MEGNIKEIVGRFVAGACLFGAVDLESMFLQELVAGFDGNSKEARRAMRKLVAHDKVKFFCAACRVLRAGARSAGHEYLVKLLVEDDVLTVCLVDSKLFSKETAVMLARLLAPLESQLDCKVMRLLFGRNHVDGLQLDTSLARRVLDILTVLPKHARILPLLQRLRRLPDPELRSMAALLFCQVSRNPLWAERQLADSDPRVRASVVEGLWGNDAPGAREVLNEGARDTDPYVAANALVGLYYLEGPTAATQPEGCRAIDQLEEMAVSPASVFRVAAARAMGHTGYAHFVPVLAAMVSDHNAEVRRAALGGLVQIRKGAGQPPGVSLTAGEATGSDRGGTPRGGCRTAGAARVLSETAPVLPR